MNKHAVIIGSPMETHVVGPFASFEDADTWCLTHLTMNQFTWIITLESPDGFIEGD